MANQWTDEQKAKACEEILAEVAKGRGLNTICKNSDDWVPSESTFRYWCDIDADLSAKYAQAREARAEVIFEQCLDIADSQENDVYIDVNGVEQTNHDVIGRAKLRIDTRRWMLGKMQPKVYGDKLDLGGSVGLTVNITGKDADL